MKKIILLTGGGTGGHIYPLLAVGEYLQKTAGKSVEIVYLGPKHFLNREFEKLGIRVETIASAKLRRYFSLANFLDIPKFFISIVQAFIKLYQIMPDAVFSKGGPGAFPVILAAKFYMIPIIIHESDAIPGVTNRISAVFAKRIAISFTEAAGFFPPKKTAFVGNPVRESLLENLPDQKQAKESLGVDVNEPLLLVLGGSQGAERINNFIVENLDELLKATQIYHQTGINNFNEVKETADSFLKELNEKMRSRYRAIPYLETPNMKTAFIAADIVLSRAGSGAIYEIAAFGKPSILIPLDGAANDHQRVNAYAYAETGAAIVIEENNLKASIVKVQMQNLLEDREKWQAMADAARAFAKPDAAKIIGDEILRILKYKSQ